MQTRNSNSPVEQLLNSPARLTALLVATVVMGGWVYFTVQTGADWHYQIAFLIVAGTLLLVICRPLWLLYLMMLICVCDVTGYLRESMELPGFMGLPVGGKQKIPETLSILIVLLLAVSYLTRQRDFRRPLVGWVHAFIFTGILATLVGVHRYVATNAFRDSLAYYCSAFYIVGMVMVGELPSARFMWRLFIGAVLFTAFASYLLCIGYHTTAFFYSGSQSMFFSYAVYFLLFRICTLSSREKIGRYLLAIAFIGAPIFLGRSRTGVFGFLVGVIPLFIAMRWDHKIKLLVGLILPLLVVMIGVIMWEASHGVARFSEFGARGIEAFTRVGDEEYDPTGNYRLVMWKMAWQGFLESPILGKGYGWLLTISQGGMGMVELPASIMHNSLLHILACSGVIGFFPLLGIIGGYFRLCWREYYRAVSRRKKLLVACTAGIALNYFFASSANVILETVSIAVVGWLILAVSLRLCQASDEELEGLFAPTPQVVEVVARRAPAAAARR